MYGNVNLQTFIVKLYCVHACWNYSVFTMTHVITYLCSSWNILAINKIIENPNADKNHIHLISDWNLKEPTYSVAILKNSQAWTFFCTWATAEALTTSGATDHTNIQKIHSSKWVLHIQIQKLKHTLAEKSWAKVYMYFFKFWPKDFTSLTVAKYCDREICHLCLGKKSLLLEVVKRSLIPYT